MWHYICEGSMEARILSHTRRLLGSHTGSQLVHEGQELVGGDLPHAHLKQKINAL